MPDRSSSSPNAAANSSESDPQAHSPSVARLLGQLQEHGSGRHRYHRREEVARGGMGVVWKVEDSVLKRELAMKVALDRERGTEADSSSALSSEFLGRFLEEAQVTGQLDHPNIVPVHELGLDEKGRIYFTMRLVRGHTLEEVFAFVRAGERNWTSTRALSVILKVCDAMAYAHSKGVIHRDLKPANVMVGRYGQVYVMDWGLARVLGSESQPDEHDQSSLSATSVVVRGGARQFENSSTPALETLEGDVLGTPAFMSPEQARGEVAQLDARTDVYSVGALLYQLFAGQPPYLPAGAKVASHTVLRWLLEGPPEPLEKLSPRTPSELIAITEKAMARDPDGRYSDMEALAEDLRAFFENRVVSAYESGATAELKKWFRRNRLVASLTCVALVAVLGGLSSVLAIQSRSQRSLQQANASLGIERDHALSAQRRAESAEQLARNAGRSAQTTLVDLQASSGHDAARAGELAVAGLWFAQAAATAEGIPEREQINDLRAHHFLMGAPLPVHLLRPEDWDQGDGRVPERVTSIEFVGEHFLVGLAEPSMMRFWDLRTGALVPFPYERTPGTRMKWNGDRSRLAVVDDGLLRVLSVPEGNELFAIEVEEFERFCLSHDGQRLALVGDSIRLFEVDLNLQLNDPPELIEGRATRPLFSRDGTRLLVSDSRGTHGLCYPLDEDGFSAEPAISFEQGRIPGQPAFLGGGPGFFTTTRERESGSPPRFAIRVYRAEREVKTIDLSGLGHIDLDTRNRPGQLKSIHASPDGQIAVLSCRTKLVTVDLNNGQQLTHQLENQSVTTPKIDAYGRVWTGLTNAAVLCLEPFSGHVFTRLHQQGAIHEVEISPNGRWLATAQAAGELVRVLRLPEELTHGYSVEGSWGDRPVQLSGDGRRMVGAGFKTRVRRGTRTRVWNVADGSPVSPWVELDQAVQASAMSESGDRLALLHAGPGTGRVVIYDTDTGAELASASTASRPVGVAFSLDEDRVIVVCREGNVYDIDVATGDAAMVHVIPNAKFASGNNTRDHVLALPDGEHVAIWGFDDQLRIYRLHPWELELSLPFDGHTMWACLSPDESLIVGTSKGGDARVFDLDTGEMISPVLRHSDWVFHAQFSPDGNELLTGSRDQLARLWNWRTGELAAPPLDHDEEVYSVGFSRDGRLLLTDGGYGKSVGPSGRPPIGSSWFLAWSRLDARPIAPARIWSARSYVMRVGGDGNHAVCGDGTSMTVLDLTSMRDYPEVQMDSEELRAMGEVSSGLRVLADGGTARLSADEWLERWYETEPIRAVLREALMDDDRN